jgi:ankyrin repeat protein
MSRDEMDSSSSSDEDSECDGNVGPTCTQEIFKAIIDKVKKHDKAKPLEELVIEELADFTESDSYQSLEDLLKEVGRDINGIENDLDKETARRRNSLYLLGLLVVENKGKDINRLETLIRDRQPDIEVGHVKGIINKFHALEDLVKRELDKHKLELVKKATDRKTILHMIAETASDTRSKGTRNLEPLIKELLRRHPDLALEQDRTKTTPLHSAIKSKERRIVRYMCDALEGELLDKVLLIQDNNKYNCLHTAVAETKSNTIIIGLIKRVKSPATYCAKNDDKLTPMHLAVDFERCNARQLEVVDAMIEHWDSALDVNVLSEDSHSSEERSVFRHHQWTCHRASQRMSEKESTTKQTASKLTKESVGKKPQESTHPYNPSVAPLGPKSTQTPSFNATKANYPQKLTKRPTTLDPSQELADHPLNVPPTGNRDGLGKPGEKKSSKNETVNNIVPTRGVKGTKPPEMSQGDAAAEIGVKLKMHYMRTRDDHMQIISFLYEPNAGMYRIMSMCIRRILNELSEADMSQLSRWPNSHRGSATPRDALRDI